MTWKERRTVTILLSIVGALFLALLGAHTPPQGNEPVFITVRPHPFPSRTRKLSSPVPKILGGKLPGKIGLRRHLIAVPHRSRYPCIPP